MTEESDSAPKGGQDPTLSGQESSSTERKPIDWIELLSAVWKSRKLIASVVGLVTVLAVIYSLILPEYFRSTATLLPETEKSKLAGLGDLSELASLAGVSTGEVSLTKLYPTIIKSESVLKIVIYAQYQTNKFKDPVNLIQFWEIKGKTPEQAYEAGLKALGNGLDVSLDLKTGVVSISMETREPQLSADIINNITSELDKFIRTKRTTNASEQRKWIEGRLVEVKRDLEKSEGVLKEFRENNRRVIDSPQLLMEQDRLIREVQINSTLYIELKKQYELAKIEEIKNIPIINVMDPARPAARKERPKRFNIVITFFLISACGSLLYVIGRDRYDQEFRKALYVFRRKPEKKAT
ncbi:MAG: Wzz/FepE/Etk N-terminal domain-containing protein [Bacteroidota bacterium]